MGAGGRQRRAALAEAQPIIWDAYALVADALSPEDVAVVVPRLERLTAALRDAQQRLGRAAS